MFTFSTIQLIKNSALLLILLLCIVKPLIVEAEVAPNAFKTRAIKTKIRGLVEQEKASKQQSWRVINDAPFLISPAPSAVKVKGETLKELGFKNMDELFSSIEKNTRFYSVDFSPDGQFIASGSSDETVKLWDIKNQKLLHTFEGHTNIVYSVAFSSDGRFLVSGSKDGSIKLWDIKNKKLVLTFENDSVSVLSVAFSPDGLFIASGSYSTVKLWDIVNQRLIHTFESDSNTSRFLSVTFSPDGRFIASGSGDLSNNKHIVSLWDIQSKELAYAFDGHAQEVYSVAFSPDGQYVASGSGDKTIKLWNILERRLLFTFEGLSKNVLSVAFSPNGRFIASASGDNTVILWDIQNKIMIQSIEGHFINVRSVVFSPDGRLIAFGSFDGTITLWDIQNNKLIHSFEGYIRAGYDIKTVAFSHDGQFIASGSKDNSIKLWDIQNQNLAYTFEGHAEKIHSVAFSPDDQFIVSGSNDNTVKLWNIQNQKLIYTFEGHTKPVYSVAFSPEGGLIVSGSSDSTVKLWDIDKQELVHTFAENSGSILTVAFSPNGRFIAYGSVDSTVKLWDIKKLKLVRSFEGYSKKVNSLAFSPDGRFIACGFNDNIIKLWNIEKQKLVHTFKGNSRSLRSITYSPDGRFIASGTSGLFGVDNNTIELWDIENKKIAHIFKGHSSYVHSVAFTVDGHSIASGSGDNTVKLWNIQTLANEMTFFSTRADSWLFINSDELVFRAEHGNLLRKKAENNDWLSVPPSDMKPKSDFSISINPDEFSISAGQGKEAELSVDVHNNGSEAVFWLKLKPSLSDDGVVRLEEPDNELKTKGQSFWKQAHITRLEPGETATIHARISSNLKFPTEFISSGQRKLTVTVVSANDTEVSQTVDVDVKLSRLEWQQATLAPDGGSLYVMLKNTGTAIFPEANVQLVAAGLSQIPKALIPELEPEQSIELAFILPKQANLFYLFKLLLKPDLLQLQGLSNQLPVFSWNMKATQVSWMLPWLMAILLVLILIAVFYLRRYRHPLVVELSDNPESLRHYVPEQLVEAYGRLVKTQMLGPVLRKNEVSEATMLNSVHFFTSQTSHEKIHYLENRLGTKAKNIQLNLWELPIPKNFPLNLNRCLVYFPSADTPAIDVFNDLKLIPEATRNTTLLIGPDSEYQRQLFRKSNDPSNKYVAPSGVELTQMMLSPEPEMILANILASQLALTLLSPYQLGGGVNSESVFFGREEIIDHILNREPANYLLAGGRQLGKSSLLKALERRFHQQGDVICFYIALSNEVLIPRLISLLKLAEGTSLDQLAQYAEKSEKRVVFLIDEADKFIRMERSNGYQILNTLRQVSEEGRCHFILAGFWELFQHAVLDYQSPLKNFAETISVGALEVDACRKLATEPMQTMRLEYANPMLVEKLLKMTGGRANLIAIVCHQIIEKLASDQRIIKEEDLLNALHSEKTLNALRGWGAMTDDEQACRLDRIIVYSTITLKGFTLEHLLDLLKHHQIKLKMKMIEQSLARLELGFVLGREQKRQYVYQVPLFQEMILTESPASKLSIEIDDWNAATDL